MKRCRQLAIVFLLTITCNNLAYGQTDYFIQNVAIHLIECICDENSSQLPLRINQTDTFTAMEISDGFLTYHYSSEMQGELLDYVMSNRDLLYDNAMSNIVSNPAALFTSALCADAVIGIRYVYTFPGNEETMNVEISHSDLLELLPYSLNPAGRQIYAKDYFSATGAPAQISEDYLTIYEKTDNASYLTGHLDENDMAELVIDAFMENTRNYFVDLVCLWLEKGFCFSFVGPDNEQGNETRIPYGKLKEIYTSLYPSSLQPYVYLDKAPEFLGGDVDTFSKWVNENLIYPEEAKENGIQGRVILRFTVDENGSLKDISVINMPDRLLAAEAIRVVSNSPKWSPGEKDNEKVNVTYTFPVVFQLF